MRLLRNTSIFQIIAENNFSSFIDTELLHRLIIFDHMKIGIPFSIDGIVQIDCILEIEF